MFVRTLYVLVITSYLEKRNQQKAPVPPPSCGLGRCFYLNECSADPPARGAAAVVPALPARGAAVVLPGRPARGAVDGHETSPPGWMAPASPQDPRQLYRPKE